MLENKQIRKKKILTLCLAALVIAFFAAITILVGKPLAQQFKESPETFRNYVNEHWFTGSLLMIGMIMLQVIVAFIPGEPFELGAGFIFGWFPGSVLCLIGAGLASAMVFLLVRKFGIKLVELFFPREKIMSCAFLKNRTKLNLLIFTLFLIPGTPKDLLTYVAGLTEIKLSHFLLLTTIARIPSVISSAVSGSLTEEGNYLAAIIIYGITLLITAICAIAYRRVSGTQDLQIN